MSDLISRKAAIDEAEEWIETYNSGRGGQRERDAIKHVISGIKKLPSAQPEPSDAVYRLYKRAYEAGQRNAQPELHFDEWCTDCKEYDQERHRCPRWNKVIRETLKDARPEIIRCKNCKHWKHDHTCREHSLVSPMMANEFCSRAERRKNETD